MIFFRDIDTAKARDLLERLLPEGRAIPRQAADGLGRTVEAIAAEVARADNAIRALLDHADPRTATAGESLDAWERVLGLPGECGTLPATEAGRQALAHARLVASRGITAGAVGDLLADLGYTSAEVVIPTLFRADESAADERLYGESWATVWYVWQATPPADGWDLAACALAGIVPPWSVVIFLDGDHPDTNADGGLTS